MNALEMFFTPEELQGQKEVSEFNAKFLERAEKAEQNKRGYRLIDYRTGKQVIEQIFKTYKEAQTAKHEYLSYNLENNVLHNNLILIESL